MITKEEYQSLKPYEADFRRVVKASYKLPTSREEDDTVINLLLKYEPRTQINRGCGNCMFRVYTRVGRMFYEYQEKKCKSTTSTRTGSTSSTVPGDTTTAKGGRGRGRKKTGDTKDQVKDLKTSTDDTEVIV